jgi:hypothetical protein
VNTINLRLKRTPSQSSNGNFLATPRFFADFKGIFASLTFVRLGKSNKKAIIHQPENQKTNSN